MIRSLMSTVSALSAGKWPLLVSLMMNFSMMIDTPSRCLMVQDNSTSSRSRLMCWELTCVLILMKRPFLQMDVLLCSSNSSRTVGLLILPQDPLFLRSSRSSLSVSTSPRDHHLPPPTPLLPLLLQHLVVVTREVSAMDQVHQRLFQLHLQH